MLSLLKTFPFAFNKRSFIIGFIILFFGTFFVFGEFCWVFHLAKENIQPTREHTQLLSIIAYLIKLIGYSILFSYVFIKAKQDAYNLPKTNPSSEFLIRVFLTIFCVQLLTDILLILSGYVFVQHYMNAIYSNPNIIIDKSFIIKHLVFPFVLLFIPISYILCHFWIPYLMNFNFSRFGYKLIQTFKTICTIPRLLECSNFWILHTRILKTLFWLMIYILWEKPQMNAEKH